MSTVVLGVYDGDDFAAKRKVDILSRPHMVAVEGNVDYQVLSFMISIGCIVCVFLLNELAVKRQGRRKKFGGYARISFVLFFFVSRLSHNE